MAINLKLFSNFRFFGHCQRACFKPYCTEELSNNPYFKKYGNKIKKLLATDEEEYQNRLRSLKRPRQQAPLTEPEKEKQDFLQHDKYAQKKKISQPLHSYTKPKTLNDVVKIDLLKPHTSDEIEKIWASYHQQKNCISAVIPVDIYDKIVRRSQEFPMFLYPIPRQTGYEFIVSQFSGNECHFTPLINFQAHSADAPPCLTMIHYTELSEEKGIVLMNGEYDSNVLGPAEAQCLANQVQWYYGGNELRKKLLLWNFNKEPMSFRHMDLVHELEKTVTK